MHLIQNIMQNTIKERFYVKYAWTIFFIIGAMLIVGGVPHFFGVNTDPKLVEGISGQTIDEIKESNPMLFDLYEFYFKGGGLSDVGFGLMLVIISFFAYKKAQKWAWYTLCFVPVYFLAWIFISLGLPEDAKSLLITPLTVITVLSAMGLILPFRKFFPKKIEK